MSASIDNYLRGSVVSGTLLVQSRPASRDREVEMGSGLLTQVESGKAIILHPFLFASFASLSLLANNLTEIGLLGIRALAFSMLATGLTFLVLKILLKDRLKAGLCASGAILLVFSYGHFLDMLQGIFPYFAFTRGNVLVMVAWIGLIASWFYVVIKRLRRVAAISNYLNIVAIVLNIIPLYSIATFSTQTADMASLAHEYAQAYRMSPEEVKDELSGFEGEGLRDIYFIVLDAYARQDVLHELYDYDNSGFVDFLHSRGFSVDQSARASYNRSEFSLASSFNMMSLDTLPGFLREHQLSGDAETVRRISKELIGNNLIVEVLRDQGYQIVTFDNGFGATQVSGADVFVSSVDIEGANFWQLGFEFMLLDTTLGRELVNLLGEERSPHRKLMDAHRQRILYTLDHLSDFAGKEGAYFVYAHIISPHVPYVFGPNGEEIRGYDPYTLLDAKPGDEANIGLYRGQVHYLNTLVMETIDDILEKSSSTPIIILQADHGSKVFSEIDPPMGVMMDLQFPILSAFLFPSVPAENLNPGFTPVNNFRRLFNQYAGSSLELLENTSYILELNEGRWEFVDVCETYQACTTP